MPERLAVCFPGIYLQGFACCSETRVLFKCLLAGAGIPRLQSCGGFNNKKDYLKNPDSKGKYGLFLLAEPCLKSVGFGDVTVEIFITTPLLEKADEFNRVLNNLDENIICEIRNGEYAKILEQYERIAKTDRLGEFERRLEQKRRKETQDRYLQGYKNGTPGLYQRRIIYMPPW